MMQAVDRGIIVPVLESVLRLLSKLSIYHVVFRYVKKRRRWSDDELIPYWYAELYVISFLVVLGLGYWLIPVESPLWQIFLFLAIYRLFDLAQGLASIFVFEPKRRQDDQGGYVLIRHGTRWVALTLLNLVEIVIYFGYIYLTLSRSFDPIIGTRIGGIYQSTASFLTGGGSNPVTDLARVVTITNLAYFVLFLVIVSPIVFSILRAKELTSEVLGYSVGDDERN